MNKDINDHATLQIRYYIVVHGIYVNKGKENFNNNFKSHILKIIKYLFGQWYLIQ